MKTNKKAIFYTENIPIANTGLMDHIEQNKPFVIYEGEFVLDSGDRIFHITGTILFDWFPNIRVHFIGTTQAYSSEIEGYPFKTNENRIIINNYEFGIVIITKVLIQANYGDVILHGKLISQSILGNKESKVQRVLFAIPNLISLSGNALQKQTKGPHYAYRGRIFLENEKFAISLDRDPTFSKLNDYLEEKGGYGITYNGELKFKDRDRSHKDIYNILECLNHFLSFINGRRVSALFIHGIENEVPIWIDYTHYECDIYKNVHIWPVSNSIDGLSEVWVSFYKMWQNKDDQYFLKYATHWYMEANGLSGYSEGSIIMAQTALELIYNWWIIENKKLIRGRDTEILSASNKIRMIISQLNIDFAIPENLKNLIEYQKENPQSIIDGPEAIIFIRNGIVHSQESKRSKLSKIKKDVKFEVLQLSLWYIELSLLSILGYSGYYTNRCLAPGFPNEVEKIVPWNKNH